MSRNIMHLTNCFFYEEWQDMGAIISHCTYGQNALYECPCKGCKHFINAEDAREIVANARTGMWVKTGQSFVYPDKFRNYMCSECGCDIEKTKYNYCPHCGAKMEGDMKMTREEALKILSCRDNRGLPITWQDEFVEAVDTAINALKQPEQKWIPCSERLPDDDEIMLVTCKPKKGSPNVNRAYYMDGAWHGSGSMSNVTAWMPLPKPYKGDEE